MSRKRRGRETTGESARLRYPLLDAYGDAKVRFLDAEEAAKATREDRIRSIWPYLVRTVLDYADSLPPRALANYDPEDVVAELYAVLAERDHLWEPARGKYLSFAGRVIAHELLAIRDRAGTVHSPRNSASRLKGYEQRGDLSGKKAKTFRDIRRVTSEHLTIARDWPGVGDSPDTLDQAERREDYRLAHQAVRRGVGALNHLEAETLGLAFGIFGRPQHDIAEIAKLQGRSPDAVRNSLVRATRKFRDKLQPNPGG